MQERGLFFTKKTQILVYVAKKQYLCTQIAPVKQLGKHAEEDGLTIGTDY